ncbi:MAG: GAF domain-containing protein [Planctomycetota bacterium]
MSLGSASPAVSATRELRLVETGEQSLDMSLDRIVAAIANHMQTDVGSLYRLERDGETLLLAATVGLLQSCVGRLKMKMSEGLVGLVAQQRSPVVLARATEHPRFKYFPEADEDEYQSFLGVPIIDRNQICGVLVVQTIEAREFESAEIAELESVARLIAPRLRLSRV